MGIISDWARTVRSEIFILNQGRTSSSGDSEYSKELSSEEKEIENYVAPKGIAKYWPIFTAGAGLFSDGYVNNSIGTVNTILGRLYPKEYSDSNAQSNVSSIAFAGTVLGQLVFGYVSDYHSRKAGMVVSTLILIIFAILAAGSWGAGGSIYGMLAALTAYRFFLGVGIGGEYPCASVACAEASLVLNRGHRNRWFVLFTNFCIDTGFVISAFVPLVLLWICGDNHLTPVWRITLGLGAIPPLSLLYFRVKFKESDQYRKNHMKNSSTPYWLAIKYYGFRLTIVSVIWFLYDFSAYSFGIYSSQLVSRIVPETANGLPDLYKTFGWNVVVNLFYIPGSFIGSICADYFGPRLTLVFGVFCQGIIGFAMASEYPTLKENVPGFMVLLGVFFALGEVGPGDQIGLIASKTSATSIRGQYYGIAAATGKIGAFVGTYVFPIIIKNAGGADSIGGNRAPYYVSSALCMLSATLALFFLPSLNQDAMMEEDIRFRNYLLSQGYDITLLGDTDLMVSSSSPEFSPKTDGYEDVEELKNQDSAIDVKTYPNEETTIPRNVRD